MERDPDCVSYTPEAAEAKTRSSAMGHRKSDGRLLQNNCLFGIR